MEQIQEEKEFLYNPKMLEGISGKILNNARVVLDEGDTIRKIWMNPETFPNNQDRSVCYLQTGYVT